MAGGNILHRAISYVINQFVVEGLANRYFYIHFLFYLLFFDLIVCFVPTHFTRYSSLFLKSFYFVVVYYDYFVFGDK